MAKLSNEWAKIKLNKQVKYLVVISQDDLHWRTVICLTLKKIKNNRVVP